jgi:hypothetical protein
MPGIGRDADLESELYRGQFETFRRVLEEHR